MHLCSNRFFANTELTIRPQLRKCLESTSKCSTRSWGCWEGADTQPNLRKQPLTTTKCEHNSNQLINQNCFPKQNGCPPVLAVHHNICFLPQPLPLNLFEAMDFYLLIRPIILDWNNICSSDSMQKSCVDLYHIRIMSWNVYACFR